MTALAELPASDLNGRYCSSGLESGQPAPGRYPVVRTRISLDRYLPFLSRTPKNVASPGGIPPLQAIATRSPTKRPQPTGGR